jgi:hypothetical protein
MDLTVERADMNQTFFVGIRSVDAEVRCLHLWALAVEQRYQKVHLLLRNIRLEPARRTV